MVVVVGELDAHRVHNHLLGRKAVLDDTTLHVVGHDEVERADVFEPVVMVGRLLQEVAAHVDSVEGRYYLTFEACDLPDRCIREGHVSEVTVDNVEFPADNPVRCIEQPAGWRRRVRTGRH